MRSLKEEGLKRSELQVQMYKTIKGFKSTTNWDKSVYMVIQGIIYRYNIIRYILYQIAGSESCEVL